MTISKLIETLQKMQNKVGDLEVKMEGFAGIFSTINYVIVEEVDDDYAQSNKKGTNRYFVSLAN